MSGENLQLSVSSSVTNSELDVRYSCYERVQYVRECCAIVMC